MAVLEYDASKQMYKKKRETICNRRPHQPWILTYMSRAHIAFNIRIHRLSRHSKSVFGNKISRRIVIETEKLRRLSRNHTTALVQNVCHSVT